MPIVQTVNTESVSSESVKIVKAVKTKAAPTIKAATTFADLIVALRNARGQRMESGRLIADCIADSGRYGLSKDDRTALSEAAEDCGFPKGKISAAIKLSDALRTAEDRTILMRHVVYGLLLDRPYPFPARPAVKA